jgi:hypothetical protein
MRFESTQRSPTVYIHARRGSFEGGTQAEEGPPSGGAPPPGAGSAADPAAAPVGASAAGPPGAAASPGSAASPLADAPPSRPDAAEPPEPPRPEGVPVDPRGDVQSALLRAALGALAAAAASALGYVVWRWTAGRPRVVPVGPPPSGRPFGLPALDGGAVTWRVPSEHAASLLVDSLQELAAFGPIVLVARPGSAPTTVEAGTLWRLPTERPDPLDVARTSRRLGRTAFVVEGPEALEPPVRGEAATAVMDELRVRVGDAPLLFVLRAEEPVPQDTREVRFEQDGADLVVEGVRLRRIDGRWRPAPA